ncbi:amidohydrolase [Roseibacterium sp. SDUM158016]|uniref:amidohydrolase family protein n=1 Tax=Roseicyclus sediminis TaxID=2980997 RepID=UPI0021CF580A|nr:amidohydrolase family protein [Roseibacterium sp. SDUM158016]MCU4651319.1 amidohydrolase [Roseibacterium sp. SDUM158016]
MSDIRITNVHVHTFTQNHVPRCYPHPLLVPFKAIPGLLRALAAVVRIFSKDKADTLDRLYRFQQEAGAWRQSEIFEQVRRHYPRNTRFVVLPMDMEPTGHGAVRKDLRSQHEELADLAAAHPDNVIPFATLHPDGEDRVAEVVHALDTLKFKGLKLYPRMGFPPDHPVLMNEVYPLLDARNLPVMTHCSRGGVMGRGVVPAEADRFTRPQAFDKVWERFPNLRVCFAHFGGQEDWRTYVEEGYDPEDEGALERNWQRLIRHRIGLGTFPSMWTDISYTLFHFEDFVPFLRLFLTGEDDEVKRLRARVLFGSDFYMTRQERLSERAVCFRLRNALGEDVFRRIAVDNPEIWLGEKDDDQAHLFSAP